MPVAAEVEADVLLLLVKVLMVQKEITAVQVVAVVKQIILVLELQLEQVQVILLL
jgi:hypothetical protein